MESTNRPVPPAPQQQASLIRPEQVQRLPQLNASQKQQFEQGVKRFWDVLNSSQQGDPKYNEAYAGLVRTSSQLMAGMKQWQQAAKQRQLAQQNGQQQQQQSNQAAATQQAPKPPVQAPTAPGAPAQPANNNTLQFSQLMPEIQRKVKEQHFYYPPAMTKGTEPAEVWLREAKTRLGQALQRLQVAKQKKAEFQRQASQRSQQGNPLTAQEQEVFASKVAQCDRAVAESTSFMKKFNEQQEQFRAAQPQNQFSKQPTAGGDGTEQTPVAHLQPAVQGPTAHSISSAVSAARNQASAAQVTSPTTAAPQISQAIAATAQATPATATQTTFPPAGAAGDASAGPRPVSHQGQPMPPQALPQSAQATIHPHPLNTSINGAKTSTPTITKNLQVTEPKPVTMPPSRPTLTGGAGVGLPGQLAQPAISTLPGYVLESSEDGRVLSKKKLNELVREICGPGPEEQLDPEAEEVGLLMIKNGWT